MDLHEPSMADAKDVPPELAPDKSAGDQHQGSRPKLESQMSSLEPRKCWICLQNETEDLPTSSRWRSPCACNLQAHEACLLDWVAEVERPKPGQIGKSKVECPQCKTPIQIVRPRSLALEAIRKFQRTIARLTVPFTAVAIVGGVTYGCYLHGLSSVYLILGSEDAERLLSTSSGSGLHSPVEMALPFVPVALLLSRSSYADSVFPVLPIFWWSVGDSPRNTPLWPPSTAMTMICLPYIRAIYKAAWKFFFAAKEEAWMKELRPRAGDDAASAQADGAGANADVAAADEEGDGLNIELGIQVEMVDDDEPAEAEEPADVAQLRQEIAHQQEQEDARRRQEAGAEQPQQQDEQDAAGRAHPAGDQPNRPANAAPNNNNVAQHAANAIPIIINVFLEKVLGALLFPSVAASVGFALQHALPRTWTIPPGPNDRYPLGFLQSRFGRSIVGGCLFIVFKDTVFLFQKYKAAQIHRKRRIMNYDQGLAKQASKH